jgi:hypothetical protein
MTASAAVDYLGERPHLATVVARRASRVIGAPADELEGMAWLVIRWQAEQIDRKPNLDAGSAARLLEHFVSKYAAKKVITHYWSENGFMIRRGADGRQYFEPERLSLMGAPVNTRPGCDPMLPEEVRAAMRTCTPHQQEGLADLAWGRKTRLLQVGNPRSLKRRFRDAGLI